jgi:hypothetical protein
LVGFVNGLLLVVIESKKPGVPARAAFDENLTRYTGRFDVPFLPPRRGRPPAASFAANAASPAQSSPAAACFRRSRLYLRCK